MGHCGEPNCFADIMDFKFGWYRPWNAVYVNTLFSITVLLKDLEAYKKYYCIAALY
jgi:hypothetical protein